MKKIVLLLACFCIYTVSAYATPMGNGPVTGNLMTSFVSGEDSLQTIMDNVFGTSVLDAVTDQSDVRVWAVADASTTAFEVTYFAGNTNTLGIYDDITGMEHTFSLGSGTGSTSFGFRFFNGKLLDSFGNPISNNWSGNFGFFLESSSNSSSNKFYTEDDMNGSGVTQAVAYQIADGTDFDLSASGAYSGTATGTATGNNDWLIAFEDVVYANSDQDFNDAVFYIKDMAPVPEPGTLLLLGFGLIGLAYLKRRKEA